MRATSRCGVGADSRGASCGSLKPGKRGASGGAAVERARLATNGFVKPDALVDTSRTVAVGTGADCIVGTEGRAPCGTATVAPDAIERIAAASGRRAISGPGSGGEVVEEGNSEAETASPMASMRGASALRAMGPLALALAMPSVRIDGNESRNCARGLSALMATLEGTIDSGCRTTSRAATGATVPTVGDEVLAADRPVSLTGIRPEASADALPCVRSSDDAAASIARAGAVGSGNRLTRT